VAQRERKSEARINVNKMTRSGEKEGKMEDTRDPLVWTSYCFASEWKN